jgi:hypothetical protein
MMFAASDFRRHRKVSKRQENGPQRETPARGPTRPWRTLTWLFLAGLRPRRARLRFTRHNYYTTEGARRKPLGENRRRMQVVAVRLHRPFFLGRRGPRGRQASLKDPVDSASLAERVLD